MPINDNYIDKLIGDSLLLQNEKEKASHKSSGKLSAGMLGSPLQWQILKSLGVETKPFDEYTLRKFKRGKDIEAWLLDQIPNKVPVENLVHGHRKDDQKFAEYRGVIGYIDCIVDTCSWDFPRGIIPVEIKSVSNAKFKRITQKNEPDRSHVLQAGLYALSEGTEWYAIAYVAADDLRVKVYLLETKTVKDEIDRIIDEYIEQIEKKEIPVFEAVEVWQGSAKYNSYPEYMIMTQEELNERLKSLIEKV